MKKIVILLTLLSIIAAKKIVRMKIEKVSENHSCNTLECNGLGEVCRISNGRAMCLCRTDCDTNANDSAIHVCDDSTIYRNQCHTDLFACQQGITITRQQCTGSQINQMTHAQAHTAPEEDTYTVGPGGMLTLRCGSSDLESVNKYIWLSNNRILVDAMSLDQQSLHFKNINSKIAGTYKCYQVKDGTILSIDEPSKVFNIVYRHLPHIAQRTFFRSACLESWWSYKLENCFSRGVTHIRWVLDHTKKICVRRKVDRCVKIQSSFESEMECNYQCGNNCDMPMVTGRNCENITNSSNVVYDKNQQACKSGEKGCGVNAFTSYTACEIICIGRRLEMSSTPPKSAVCPDNCAEMWSDGYCNSDFILFASILKISRKLIVVKIISVIKDHPYVNLSDKMQTSHTTQIALVNDNNCLCGNMAYKDLKRRFRQRSTNGYLISGNYYRGRPHVSAYIVRSVRSDRPYKESSKLLEALCGGSSLPAPHPSIEKNGFKIATNKDFISRVNQFEKRRSSH